MNARLIQITILCLMLDLGEGFRDLLLLSCGNYCFKWRKNLESFAGMNFLRNNNHVSSKDASCGLHRHCFY